MTSAGTAAPGRAHGRTLGCRGLRGSAKERHHGHSQARREHMNHGQGRVRHAGLDAAERRDFLDQHGACISRGAPYLRRKV
jgi:hypothetical protein